ncbi:ubiquitin carboxyl-terminal hydrolase [Colletotrichum asianum]
MVATDSYAIMSPPDSPPMTQHWEGRAPQVKEEMVGKSGRLAPRWVHDLLNSELDVGSFTNIQWDPNARCSRKGASHTLVLVGNQSTADAANPGVLSCVCTTCDFHFLIRRAWDPDQLVQLCQPAPLHFSLKETDFYLHHLVNVRQSSQHQDYTSEYHPLIKESLIAVEHFACSAPRCTFQVTAEISRPRLKREWVQLLTDQQRILDNLANARKESPDRFADARDDWCTSAPSTLNTYLRDLLDKPNPRNISQRNKRFHVVFGEECYVIFRAIQFSEETLEKDEVPEPYFIPPKLEPGTPGTPTKISTLRAFIEDMQAETESLIVRSGRTGESRAAAGNRLSKELQCFDYPRNKTTSTALKAHRTLGVLPDFDRALIIYAYKRQSVLCEQRRADYVAALRDIAQEHADDEFQTQAVQELTLVERTPSENHGAVDELQQQAYSFFSLQYTASDDEVISAYNRKIEHSPSQADFAREMMQVIGRHRSSDRILLQTTGPMDISTAYRILETEKEWPDDSIRAMSEVKVTNNAGNKPVIDQALNALEAIANDRKSDMLHQTVLSWRSDAGSSAKINSTSGLATASEENTKPRLDLPAGLENIGNTCYLNSILQYLRTVVPLRTLLAQYANYQLGQDESEVTMRRIGGNKLPVEQAEAVIARIFVEELSKLLEDLDKTKETAIRPSQRLANAVLLPTIEIKKQSNAEEGPKTQEVMGAQFPLPPPLPARPAPVPPAKSVEHVGPLPDANMVNITVDPVSGSASSVSSQTLVSLDADQDKNAVHEDNMDVKFISEHPVPPSDSDEKDVQMVDAPAPSVEERVLKALETQKRSSGTDQQDVEEVMGSIINRLQAAIKPTETDSNEIQWEPIMNTFYVELANHTKMPNQEKFTAESILERAITAYPAEGGPSTIEQGLDRNFNVQRVATTDGHDIMRFTSIKRLPPILHVLIQRTKNDGRKNMNPVQVSETLCLDKHMDAAGDPEALKLKQKGWVIQERLDQLCNNAKTSADDPELIDKFIDGFVRVDKPEEEKSVLTDEPTTSLSFAGEELVFPAYASPPDSMPEKVDAPVGALAEARQKIKSMREEEMKARSTEHDALFQTRKQVYRLQAVICHSGQLNAGHYWVWIHDFEDNIWRKYNDRTVTENASTEKVLELLNSNGDPYYLCYVDDKKLDLVKVPKRNLDADGDIDLIDVQGHALPSETGRT